METTRKSKDWVSRHRNSVKIQYYSSIAFFIRLHIVECCGVESVCVSGESRSPIQSLHALVRDVHMEEEGSCEVVQIVEVIYPPLGLLESHLKRVGFLVPYRSHWVGQGCDLHEMCCRGARGMVLDRSEKVHEARRHNIYPTI